MRLLSVTEAKKVIEILEDNYKDAHYYLNFSNPTELLVAAILSAQTKDEVVNASTNELFKHYKTIQDYAHASPDELLPYINKISFAKKKAEMIIKTCNIIEKEYNGKIPDSMDELLKLPGIGRKTANTILINAYNKIEGIPVDTWVIKLSYRIGFSKEKDPDKIEKDLMSIVDKKYWHNFAYVLKNHGKAICNTIPYCSKCIINSMCPKNGVTKSR